jgi:hypothetical protein
MFLDRGCTRLRDIFAGDHFSRKSAASMCLFFVLLAAPFKSKTRLDLWRALIADHSNIEGGSAQFFKVCIARKNAERGHETLLEASLS